MLEDVVTAVLAVVASRQLVAETVTIAPIRFDRTVVSRFAWGRRLFARPVPPVVL